MIAYAQFGTGRGPFLTHKCETLKAYKAPAYAPNRSLHVSGTLPDNWLVQLGGEFGRSWRRVYRTIDNKRYIDVQGEHVRIDLVQA